MSERMNELRLHDRNSCITMESSLSCNAVSHTPARHYYTIPILQSRLACVRVFLATRSALVFPARMCQDGNMLRIQSDGS